MDLTTVIPFALLDAGQFSTLAAAGWVSGALTVLFLSCSVILILTILIQRPQGGGLSGAFGGGGGGSGETAFGARTGDALTIATISIFVIWLLIAVGLVLDMRPSTTPNPNAAAVSTETPAQTDESSTAPADEKSNENAADQGSGDASQDQGNATDQPPATDAVPGSDTVPTGDTPPETDTPDTPSDIPSDVPSDSTDSTTDTPNGSGGE